MIIKITLADLSLSSWLGKSPFSSADIPAKVAFLNLKSPLRTFSSLEDSFFTDDYLITRKKEITFWNLAYFPAEHIDQTPQRSHNLSAKPLP